MITTSELDHLCAEFVATREKYERAKEVASELYKDHAKVEFKLMAALKRVDKLKYPVAAFGDFVLKQTYSFKTPKEFEEKKKFLEYLKTKGEEFFIETVGVNHNTLNGFCNAEFENAAENNVFPFAVPGIGAPKLSEKIVLKPNKKKKGE